MDSENGISMNYFKDYLYNILCFFYAHKTYARQGRKLITIVLCGFIFICLPAYNSNFWYFKVKCKVHRKSSDVFDKIAHLYTLVCAKIPISDVQSRKKGKDQQSIQSITTPDPGYRMGK